MRIITLFLIALITGCGYDYRAVPSGFAGKVLTPTGFQTKVYTSGQVDIGVLGAGKIGNSLILIENTSITVKESFLGPKASADKEDHRIVLQEDMIPMSVDVRISFMSPDFSEADTDKLFTLITPEPWGKDDRIQIIKLEKVYETLAKMGVRTAIRKVFDSNTKNYKHAIAHREELNNKLGAAILKEIKESGIPLRAKAVDLSMLMPDESIWKINAQVSSAEAQILSLRKLASEIDTLPNGLEIYRLIMMREVVEIGSKNGTNTVIYPIGANLPIMPKVLPKEKK